MLNLWYRRRSNYASSEKYLFCLHNATLEIGQAKLRHKIRKRRIIRNSSCRCCVPAYNSSCPCKCCMLAYKRYWQPLYRGLGLYSAQASDAARATCCSSPHILEQRRYATAYGSCSSLGSLAIVAFPQHWRPCSSVDVVCAKDARYKE